jgi:thiol-disulfide isomerase/thioredoxin
MLLGTVFINAQPVQAMLTDDNFDGNIFALYGGNGSIVPPRISLAQSLEKGRPAMVVFYVDDSADCKRFSPILNLAQGFYGKTVSLIALSVDSLDLQKKSYAPTEEAYYYKGTVPQTVLIDGDGKVRFDRAGIFGFEELDSAIRGLLGLPDAPPELKFRKTDKVINELNP